MIKYLAKRGGSIYVVNVDYAGATIYQSTVKPIAFAINPRSTDFSRIIPLCHFVLLDKKRYHPENFSRLSDMARRSICF
jgi:hypothetical protein